MAFFNKLFGARTMRTVYHVETPHIRRVFLTRRELARFILRNWDDRYYVRIWSTLEEEK